jgi:hypothetical protein
MSATDFLRYRQVHLDFHTGADIPVVADQFDPEEFVRVLQEARVNSITCFARCHHGLLYYDSKAFPERVHPNLVNKNLLKNQIEACRRAGIRVPIYMTVQIDQYTVNEHPEWLAQNEKGQPLGTAIFDPGFYRRLCVNSPYRDFLKAQTREVLEMFDVDGVFYDIVNVHSCSCKYCRAGMEEQGLNPIKQRDRLTYAQGMLAGFMREMTAFVRSMNKECTIFYNRGHIGAAHRPVVESYSHLELESLPGGSWGYLHFPITMRYARNLGIDCLAQTGKFHTTWGDFHSFKNEAALQFEVFNMLALGAKCMIGDQLEPSGKLSAPVYDLIGSVYREVEKKEPWCQGAKPVVDIGVFTPEEFYRPGEKALSPAAIGITRMLQECAQQFDFIDSQNDLSRYKVLILPDTIPVNQDLAAKLAAYSAKGGAILATFESGLDLSKSRFYLPELGVSLRPDPTLDVEGNVARNMPYIRGEYAEYVIPSGEIGSGLPETEHVMYSKGVEIEAAPGTQILTQTIKSFFDRTYKHYSSHRQTPSSGEVDYPAIVKNGNAIYFAHPIFAQYYQNAPRWCKQLFRNALKMLLPEPLVTHNGPSTLLVTLNEQAEQNRRVLHLLHYIPERRSNSIDIVEDIIPLQDLGLSVNTAGRPVKKVICVPEQRSLDFTVDGERVNFVLPKLNGHQMIALEY